jgi:hypothetical protein
MDFPFVGSSSSKKSMNLLVVLYYENTKASQVDELTQLNALHVAVELSKVKYLHLVHSSVCSDSLEWRVLAKKIQTS